MSESNAGRLGWGWIIAIMLAAGVGMGAVLGVVGGTLGLPPAVTTASVGAAIGVVGAFLIARRRTSSGE
jgi:hypothetical protein